MIPIVTPAEMTAIDEAAPEPTDVLIDRAGAEVARAALAMLGGGYGRRVVVVAGPGNNGADGRVAARRLARRGVHCQIIEPDSGLVPACDLVIDAAYGSGLARPYDFPTLTGEPLVLAVDIPSGVDGLTGRRFGNPAAADVTVTFAALKPGLLIEPGRSFAGEVVLADIGLDVSGADVDLVERSDVVDWWPHRSAVAHKWNHAVRIVGGSPGMTGAPTLAALAAQRMGAGYVQMAVPGETNPISPLEAVSIPLSGSQWSEAASAGCERFGCVLVGPGLGAGHESEVVQLLAMDRPIVLDGDALQFEFRDEIAARSAATVLTPHGGEFARLAGASGDPIAATRELAADTRSIVVHKGPTTIIAAPDGPAMLVASGDSSLATAGTGDVLAGTIAALVAQDLDPFRAAATGAWVHAEAGRGRAGLVASDLPELMAAVVADLA